MNYLTYYALGILCLLLSLAAGSKVKNTYAKYDKVRTRMGITGYDAAQRLIRTNHITGITVGRVSGTLSDHYDPGKGVVNLSESTYGSASVAAVAVAAHEMGHVMQKKTGYLFYRIRTAIVPVVNIGSRLAIPLVLIGLLLEGYVTYGRDTGLGYDVAMLGVILYGLSFLFHLVTLPVELNASARAAKMLVEAGVLYEDELPGARKVLSAAAMTYLASMITSLVYFLRFLFWVLSMFGRRRD